MNLSIINELLIKLIIFYDGVALMSLNIVCVEASIDIELVSLLFYLDNNYNSKFKYRFAVKILLVLNELNRKNSRLN